MTASVLCRWCRKSFDTRSGLVTHTRAKHWAAVLAENDHMRAALEPFARAWWNYGASAMAMGAQSLSTQEEGIFIMRYMPEISDFERAARVSE